MTGPEAPAIIAAETETEHADGTIPGTPLDTRESASEVPEVIGQSTDEGYIETTVEPSTGERMERIYFTPYAYSETTTLPDGSVHEGPYRESSDVPLIPVEHPAWEHFTGKSYEAFVAEARELLPETRNRPYDAQDVLEGSSQRRIIAYVTRDPRFLETVISPEHYNYRESHKDIKDSMEKYNALGEAEKAAWEQEWAAFEEVRQLDLVVHMEDAAGNVSELTTDFNVSDARTWTGNYTLTTTGESPYRRQAVFVRQPTALGELFLETDDSQL